MTLQPVKIKNKITNLLVDLYDPIFNNIHIYGTEKKPLFKARDVCLYFGISNLHVEKMKEGKIDDVNYDDNQNDNKSNVEEIHFIRAKIKTTGGDHEAILLTETGLIKAIFKSKKPIAYKYQIFITTVMSRLRTKGVVHMDDVVRDYTDEVQLLKGKNNELKKLLDDKDKKLKQAEEDLEWEHEQLEREKRCNDVMYEQKLYSEYENENLTDTINNHNHTDYYDREEQLKLMREKYMKAIYVKLMQPPVHLKEDYDYNAEDECPTRDDTYVYSVTSKKPKENKDDDNSKENNVGKFYIHKEQTLEQVKKLLEDYGARVSKNFKTIYGKDKEKFMANRFLTSIDEINNIIKDFTNLPLKDKKIDIDPKLKEEEDMYYNTE